jgi:gliding motility-associated-like protein
MRKTVIIFFCVICSFFTNAQECPLSSLGQNPSTAFPVCGTTVFQQLNVPLCSSNALFVPGCIDGAAYENKNPYWYKFTCYQSGTLGFVITPIGSAEDYDWQLYDVTGLDPNQVYTNHNIIVTGNWSGSYGPTGTQGNTANSTTYDYRNIRCASDPAANEPRFQTMPPLIQGHNYLLLISHYTDNQSGYTLSFGGGTANITDPINPHLSTAFAPCDGTEISVKTNKKMKCNTLQSNGSDFFVIGPLGDTTFAIGASSAQCAAGFDMDSMSVFLPTPLSPGTYKIAVKNGSNDFNTLLDNCDRPIPVGEFVSFTVYPLLPTPFDSITKPKCSPQTLELVFKKKINCNSIAPDGSDFSVTGPYPVTVTAARAICDNTNGSYKIFVDLSAPLQTGGNFFIDLQQGSDGNTIIDECSLETAPASLNFLIKDTVNANFTSNDILYACDKNIVNYRHNGAHGVNFWHWSFGSAPDNFTQNPSIVYTNFENKTTTLIVSNGVCSDTATATIKFNNYLKADFEVSSLVCPEDKAVFINKTVSNANIISWKWTIGNGNIITVKDPAPQIFNPLISSDYTALPELIVQNDFGCYDTINKPVQVIFSCYIAVPTAFTPNADGLNDYLYPLKAYKSSGLSFSIYNRFGQRVFYSTDWQNKWDGTYNNQPQNAGTYVWILDYINVDTKKREQQKGTSILIR